MTGLDRGLGDINSCLDACDALPNDSSWFSFSWNDPSLDCYANCNSSNGITLGPAPIPQGTLNFLQAAMPLSPTGGSSSSLWIGIAIVGAVVLLSGKL